MDPEKEEFRISWIGEFAERNLEQDFFNDYIARNLKYLRPAILIFGILYMLFIVPDYLFIADQKALIVILANRAVFFMLILIFFFATKTFDQYQLLPRWITAYEILGGISFILIFNQYPAPNFLIQTMGLIILISTFFIVPNRWIYMLFASVLIIVAFLVFSAYRMEELPISEFSAGVVYLLIVLLLFGFISFLYHRSNRRKYAYSKQLLNLTAVDRLTGIYNRAKWDQELERWITYANRYETPLAVIFFDIDDFKSINDAYGHLTGDKVIVGIADIVRHAIRECDIFARWGGDEFMLLLPNTDEMQARALAERLQASLAEHPFDDAGTVTCSFGVTSVQKNDNGDCLVWRIDQLLYSAKQSGKNRICGSR